VSHSTVARVWAEHDLKPWQTETCRFSTDPELEARVRDAVGGTWIPRPTGSCSRWTTSPRSRRWNRRSRLALQLHFTPIYASWLNLVEMFVGIIERQALRRGDFASVRELVTAIRRFCDGWTSAASRFAGPRTPTSPSPRSTG
jgi:hypothetical protein